MQEQRRLLEEDLTCLVNEICDTYHTERFHLLAYKYICLKLGTKVLPQRRYAALSGLRAVYSDASFEWQRRLKVKPEKFINVDADFPALDEKIKKLSEKIMNIASQGEPYSAWQGLFNYSITFLGRRILNEHKNEGFASLITGVLEYLHDHFYEAEMAVYENEQINRNGDIF